MHLVSLARGARVLGVAPDTLKKLIDTGEIKTIRVSPSRVKIDLPQLISWIERGGMQATVTGSGAPVPQQASVGDQSGGRQ